jgi:hypothetical protein
MYALGTAAACITAAVTCWIPYSMSHKSSAAACWLCRGCKQKPSRLVVLFTCSMESKYSCSTLAMDCCSVRFTSCHGSGVPHALQP